MNEAIPSPLEAWGSFYVIVGSSAGALTGLQFVVMTLIAQTGPSRSRGETISAFGTPNVVHFCAALLVASVLTAPWSALRQAGLAVAGCGALGVFYSVVVMRRAQRQRGYQPVFEDWLWHAMLPSLAYSAMFVAGAMLGPDSADLMFVIAAGALLLVFIGIHNAWDTVTYLMVQSGTGEETVGTGGGAELNARGGADVRAGAMAAGGPSPGPSSTPRAASSGETPASRTPDTFT